MGVMQNILALIAALGVLIAVHEYGHFWVARRCGVKVLRFSIGFGPTLLSWTDKYNTEYVVAAIPFGGYVRMLDEREAPVPDELLGQAFNRKPVMQRIAIVAAGPIVNLGFAVILYWAMFVNGVTGMVPVIGHVEPESLAQQSGLEVDYEIISIDGRKTPSWQDVNFALISRLGDDGEILMTVQARNSDYRRTVEIPISQWMVDQETTSPLTLLGIQRVELSLPPVIGGLQGDGAAEQAGFLEQDLVLRVEDQEVYTWADWVEVIQANPGKNLTIWVQRNQQQLALVVAPKAVDLEDGRTIGRIGAMPYIPEEFGAEHQRVVRYGVVAAWLPALEKTWQRIVLTYQSIWKMLKGIISVDNLSGPITIAQVAGTTASYGLEAFLGFIAYLSISLGVLNLLPIPVLDGGHLMYFFVELVSGKAVSERIQMMGVKIGLSLIMAFMLLALYNDIARISF